MLHILHKKVKPVFSKYYRQPKRPTEKAGPIQLQNETGKYKTTYTLSDITDSTIIVDFKTNATTASKAVIMGRETTTTMNSTSTGKIILDKITGIVKEKTIAIESNGNTEAMGGTLPVTAKSTIVIHVKSE